MSDTIIGIFLVIAMIVSCTIASEYIDPGYYAGAGCVQNQYCD